MHPYHVATFRVLFNPRDKLSYCLFYISGVFGRLGMSIRMTVVAVEMVVAVVEVEGSVVEEIGGSEGVGGGGGVQGSLLQGRNILAFPITAAGVT